MHHPLISPCRGSLVLACCRRPGGGGARLVDSSVALAQPTDLDGWLRIDAAGFELYSNAEPETALRVARGLEAFRAVFGGLAPELDLDSAAPTVVFAFRDAEQLRPLPARRRAGRAGNRPILESPERQRHPAQRGRRAARRAAGDLPRVGARAGAPQLPLRPALVPRGAGRVLQHASYR